MANAMTAARFDDEVLHADKPVLVDFWASWCGPCRMLAPVIDSLEAEHSGILVYKVNVDEEGSLAERYGVMSIPTVICFKNGEEAGRSVGLVPKEKLEALL